MYPLKTRTIEYKANDSNPDKNKNQKNMILNESKTNISDLIETQDHEEKTISNDRKKIEKVQYIERENRFMQKKTKRNDSNSDLDFKNSKKLKKNKRKNLTLIKLFSDESESEETSSNKRPKLKENSKETIKNTAITEQTEKEKN